MLNSDRDGFLIADAPASRDELLRAIQGIEHNTQILLRVFKAQAKLERLRFARAGRPSTVLGERSPASGQPAARRSIAGARDSGGRFAPRADPVADAVRQLTRQQARENAERARAEAARRSRDGEAEEGDQERDARGRFVADPDFAYGDPEGGKKGKDGMFARLKDAINRPDVGAVDKVDPAIEAAGEMKNLVEGAFGGIKAMGDVGRAVMGRGFSGAQKDKAIPWYKRMLQQLKLMRKDDGVFQRAELRVLRDQRPGGGGGDGIIMTVLKTLFGPIGIALIGVIAGIWVTIGDKIVSAWSTGINWIKGKWDSAIKTFMGIWEPIAKFFSDKFGIVTNAVRTVAEKTVAVVAKAADTANTVVAEKTGVNVKENLARSRDVVASKGGSLLENVVKGYRHKALFDGIKGGDKLTEFGRYTDSEAAKVRQLKTSGANTSANLPGGMSQATKDKITTQAVAARLNPDDMLKMAAMESGGNPNAISATGAIGTYQFVGRTASGVGIKDRFDEDQNIAGAMKLTNDNKAILTAAKLPVTAENLYMMHQLGPDAAKEVIRAASEGKKISDLTAATREGIGHNYGNKSATAAGYIAANKNALNARGELVLGTPSAAPTRTAKAAVVPGFAKGLDAHSMARASAFPALAAATPAPSVQASPIVMKSVMFSPPPPPPPTPRADSPVALNSRAPLEVTVRNDKLAPQDMKDRRLAQIATGGLSN